MYLEDDCPGCCSDPQHVQDAGGPPAKPSQAAQAPQQPVCKKVRASFRTFTKNNCVRWKSQHVEAFSAGKRCVHYTGMW